MSPKKFFSNLIVRLILAVIVGIVLGSYCSEGVIKAILPARYIFGQLIFFLVPLIILGFVAPSITRLQQNASRLLALALVFAYLSSVGSGLFGTFLGYEILPRLHINPVDGDTVPLPELIFQLDIPPLMSVMSALVIALMLGLAVVWTKSRRFEELLYEYQNIVLTLINRVLIPVLPFFIAFNFTILAYQGALKSQLPVFLSVIAIVIAAHFVWLVILYSIAGIYAKKNPWRVAKHYGPAYLTALGTMSSAATLAVALKSAGKSDILRSEVRDFGIPLFANIHLCGSVLTEVFFVMTVSQFLYGSIPGFGTMLLFIVLLGIFAVGAPGVPGGTVMASLGIIVSVLGFDEAGTALMLTIFALQDSFGTACNITGDGALTLMLSASEERYEKKHGQTPSGNSGQVTVN